MDNSRLFTFIDKKNSFNLYYLHGERLMQDIYNIHNIGPVASKFYDQTILTSVHLINFTKINENLGYYIDSESPYFRFKIEMNHAGTLRTLLLPEEFSEFPSSLSGKARISISYPNKQPYSSIINLEGTKPDQVFNELIKTSYQLDCETFLGNKSSILLKPLPASNIDSKFDEIETATLDSIVEEYKNFVNSALMIEFKTEDEITNFFEEKGFFYLSGTEVKFNCPCSKERMVTNLLTLTEKDRNDIFKDGAIEIRCDYCNTTYHISEEETENKIQ